MCISFQFERYLLGREYVIKMPACIIKDFNTLTKAPSLYHQPFTGIKHSVISSGDLEELIYSTVIHYCNFDRDLPVPDIYKTVCSERVLLCD